MNINIHPVVDAGIKKGSDSFLGGTLRCKCSSSPIEVKIESQVAFNHACGCTKCWKPSGALFSVVGVVPKEKVSITAHPEKLQVIDDRALIQRHSCSSCGTHLYGRIENKERALYGLDFIHTELSKEEGWHSPLFAAFVSSIIESGTLPSKMNDVRKSLKYKGLEVYDCLSPVLMDLLATHATKAKVLTKILKCK